MATESEEDPVKRALEQCMMIQCMIDFTAKHLYGLRTQCATTEEITQNEIKESESKLIKLYSKQLVAKAKLATDTIPCKLSEYPNTQQWLKIVGVNEDVIKGIINCNVTLESLLEMPDEKICKLLNRLHSSEDDSSKLIAALRNLNTWTERQLQGDRQMDNDIKLHWTFYKPVNNSPCSGNSPKLPHAQRPSTSSLPADTHLNTLSSQSPPTPPESTPTSPVPYTTPGYRRRYTPPPTPPQSRTKGKFPTTPPPQKRNKLYPDGPGFPLIIRSKSHESQLANRIVDNKIMKKKPNNLMLEPHHGSSDAICKRRRSTEGSDTGGSSRGPSGQTSPLMTSPKRSPPYQYTDQVSLPGDIHPKISLSLVVPKSPRTPLGSRSMLHSINHRFTTTFKITSCDFCQKQMFLGYKCKECKFQTKFIVGDCDICKKHVFLGKVCRYCKFKCHRDCAAKAAPACGLPNEYVDYFVENIIDASPNIPRKMHHQNLLSADHTIRQASSVPAFQAPDSSSNTSSCNSSTPSSPALHLISHHTDTSSSSAHQSPKITFPSFQFPDVKVGVDSIGSAADLETAPSVLADRTADVINTNTSNDSDKSDKTIVDINQSNCEKSLLDRADSQESTEDGLSHSWHRQNSNILERLDSQESTEDGLGHSWRRLNSISVTLKEWDIPYEDLTLGDKIGAGRFGTVYKGQWHGDVAIKMLNMDSETDNQSQLTAFKFEVAMLRKTRHDNLVLFMGACMKPPHLGIVTSLCKGFSLYTYIHLRREKFPMNKTVIVSSQIAQGMGYLHAKGIIHKDLKSKNIFLESGKVVITDFGLFHVTKLCQGNRKGEFLSIPPGWLCYLSPELMRSLQAHSQHADMDLPFSEASDVYAFGTVWYELLCAEWPFRSFPPEAIIWQVGRGMKQALTNVLASRDVKDVLMMCWAYKPDDRPDFSQLLKTLERIPKARLIRSPSHPIQLSRSAECVF